MSYDAIKTEYLCYLMNRAGLEAEGDNGFLKLCEILQDTEFIPQEDMDENRCSECRELREDFAEYLAEEDEELKWLICDELDDIYSGNGTMMELLTVLAEAMEYQMLGSMYEANTRKWFTEMLGNCGLYDRGMNKAFKREDNEEYVRGILETVIFRKTGWDGEGGIFPLARPHYDQRKVEIAIQMNNYIGENYDI